MPGNLDAPSCNHGPRPAHLALDSQTRKGTCYFDACQSFCKTYFWQRNGWKAGALPAEAGLALSSTRLRSPPHGPSSPCLGRGQPAVCRGAL